MERTTPARDLFGIKGPPRRPAAERQQPRPPSELDNDTPWVPLDPEGLPDPLPDRSTERWVRPKRKPLAPPPPPRTGNRTLHTDDPRAQPVPEDLSATIQRRRIADRYQLGRIVGEGGMGAVYVAHDEKFRADVAIKICSLTGRKRKDLRERFVREARIGFSIGTLPGVVRAIDWGDLDDGEAIYLVMDFVDEARTLNLLAGEQGKRLELLAEAAAIVSRLHAKGVIHRDLKPANFLVDRHGRLFLTDFGLAKTVKEDTGPLPGAGVHLTQEAMVLGTPNYMAVEQFEDAGKAGPAADVYALSAMLFELLTGQLPYGPGNPIALLGRIAEVRAGKVPAPRPRDLVPYIPGHLDEICARGLSLDPAARPSIDEFRATLALNEDPRVAETPPPTPAPTPAPSYGTPAQRPVTDTFVLPQPERGVRANFGADGHGFVPADALRAKLRTWGDERFRETLRGYWALWCVQERPIQGSCHYLEKVALLPPTSQKAVVGRLPGNDVVMALLSISKRHLELSCEGERWRVADLGSHNGSWLEGARLFPSEPLFARSGARIGLSQHLTLQLFDPTDLCRRLAAR